MSIKLKIAGWQVEQSQCLLINGDKQLKLEPKLMALLVVLAEAKGELVSRQFIFDAVWPSQHVSDYALNTLIASLRKILGQLVVESQTIETRPKLGYRLSLPIDWSESPKENTVPLNNNHVNNQRLSNFSYRLFIYTLAFILLVSGVIFFLYKPSKQDALLVYNESEYEKQIRYLTKVNINYTHSEKDKSGDFYCENYSYETVAFAIYKDKSWKILGQYFNYSLKHSGDSLLGVEEVHRLEYQHVLGTEVDIMTIVVDERGTLNGHADMQVFDKNGKLLCKGMSVFIGEKL